MKFSKYNNPAKKRAIANAKARARAQKPYAVIVYNKKSGEMIEKKRFSTYDNATDYASIYTNSENLGAFIE